MGKGFNNYMCKKFFHPASRDNLKRVWMAEQQSDSYKKKQEELRVQYEKEQDLYTNKAIMSKDSKEKLSLNFMYEPPPGTKKDREREDDEPEFKFEWQRKYNAPREDYCKGDQEIRDQPFGIQVRNVRCIKCHKWGHINTDKECPMFHQSGSVSGVSSSLNQDVLLKQMREDGLAMKKGAVDLLEFNSESYIEQSVPSGSDNEDHINESELQFLKGLSTKKKMKLLRKLEKLEEKEKSKKKKLKKEKKSKRRTEKGKDKSSGSSTAGDEEEKQESSKKETKRIKEKREKNCSEEKELKYKSIKMEHLNHQTSNKERDIKPSDDILAALGRRMEFNGPPPKKPKQYVPNGQPREGRHYSYSRDRHDVSRSGSRSPEDRSGHSKYRGHRSASKEHKQTLYRKRSRSR